MLAIDNGKARAFTRNGYDWTARYPFIKDCASLGAAVLVSLEFLKKPFRRALRT